MGHDDNVQESLCCLHTVFNQTLLIFEDSMMRARTQARNTAATTSTT